VPVSARYTLAADGSLGFALGDYDPAYALTLDPALAFSTYLGGNGGDSGYGIAVDADGNVYVTGVTSSTDFPTVNAVQPTPHFSDVYSSGDAFVLKLTPGGNSLVYATYLGGTGGDVGWAIAVDSAGNAYVAGDTLSHGDFPVVNAPQPVSGGATHGFEGDAFVAKLAPGGNSLVYSTYLGGNADELAYAIAVDGAGRATVAGVTTSLNFPTVRAPQPMPGFIGPDEVPGDAFVTQIISASGVYTWGYSTYLGGTNGTGQQDVASGIVLDADGNAIVTGRTGSSDFPLAHPIQATYGGGTDAFVTKIISASGVYTWGYSTYLGGSGTDSGYGIAVDDTGAAYVTGQTDSADFPTKNAMQGTKAGDDDAFITKIISASGVYTWGYSTYLGGNGRDGAHGIALDGAHNAILTGNTLSTDFPVTADAYDQECGGDGACDISYAAGYPVSYADAFVARLNASGAALVYGTYLGGSRDDRGSEIALDGSNNAYIVGVTNSADFPTTTGAYDTGCGTNGACDGQYAWEHRSDAFVAKIALEPDRLLVKSADPSAGSLVTRGDAITYTLVLTNAGSALADVVITDVIPAGAAYWPGSAVTNLGNASFDGNQVVVSTPNLASGAALTATFRVTVTTGLTATLANKAVLAANQAWLQDSNPVSHRVRRSPVTSSIHLPVVIKALPAPPSPGCAPALVASIPVGDTPRGVAVAPGRVYVANYGSDSVSVIDSAGNAVLQTLGAIPRPNGVAYDSTHNRIWVTNYSTDQVTPIDGASLTPLPPVAVGYGPWGVAYDPVHDFIYVVNHLGNSVTVVNAVTRTVVATLTGTNAFSQPFHIAANPVTGKVYVTNFGTASVAVVNGLVVGPAIDLDNDDPSTQPYGIAVDETRNLVYVATVDSHRVVAINGATDQVLNWAEFHRGSNPARPVPLRVLAVNPGIGSSGDGGHIWATTSTADGSEANQALLIPKGWGGGFAVPVPAAVGANPAEGIAVDRASGHVYVTSGGAAGTVTVLADGTQMCPIAFSAGGGIEVEVGRK
jgi:uncharacterized repeat protein (TIGR01451 family)